jgi:[acyl-carrier-protein] S-malonyltransferase
MARTAFLFPGQGSQYVGMGSDLAAAYPSARDLILRSDAILGFALSEAMFGRGDAEADAEALRRTEVTQPALFVHSLAVLAVLEGEGISFDMAAGHSLGEYSALTAAGALAFEDALRLVRLRGELMARAGDDRPGGMAAVIGMDDADLEAACRELSVGGVVVQPANYNSPGQVVISGDRGAVERAAEVLPGRGARKVVPLPVSGAFHSPLMTRARDGLAQALADVRIWDPAVPVWLNVTARPSRDAGEIRERLLEQLLAPVRWTQTMESMHGAGATRFVEIGAGRVLSGLAKRTIGREVETLALGTVDDINALTRSDLHREAT